MIALLTLRALVALLALRALIALVALLALRALRAGRAGHALFALLALLALRALHSGRADLALRTLRARGARIALITLLALGTLLAGRARRTFRTHRAERQIAPAGFARALDGEVNVPGIVVPRQIHGDEAQTEREDHHRLERAVFLAHEYRRVLAERAPERCGGDGRVEIRGDLRHLAGQNLLAGNLVVVTDLVVRHRLTDLGRRLEVRLGLTHAGELRLGRRCDQKQNEEKGGKHPPDCHEMIFLFHVSAPISQTNNEDAGHTHPTNGRAQVATTKPRL